MMPQQITLPWQSDMQLAGKLVLSAAALLLLTLAYRFYNSRSLPGAKIPPSDPGEERENAAQDGDGTAGLRRRRRVLGEEARRDGGDGQGSGRGSVPGTPRHTPAQGDGGLPRGEEEEDGGEMDSELGLSHGRGGNVTRGREVGSESGSATGIKPGSESGCELGSKPRIKPGTKLGCELGIKLGSKPGIKLGSELGSKWGSNLASKPGTELGCELESKPGSELGCELGSKPGSELGSKWGSNLASKPASKLGSNLASQMGSEPGSELGCELESKPEIKPGTELGCELGSKPGIKPGSELGSKSGSNLASKPGTELGSYLASKPASKLGSNLSSQMGSELGSKLGSESESNLASKPGIELGSDLANKLGSKPGNELGSDLSSQLGTQLGSNLTSKPGNKMGSDLSSQPGCEPRSFDPEDVAKPLSSLGEEGILAPGTGLSFGITDAQMAGDGCTQSMEQSLAATGVTQETKECRGTIQTLSVTSGLGLTMMTSNMGSDASYSFSSTAKIQVKENYISEQRVKDGAGQPVPSLKGKVYDYYVQSISQSVSKKRSCYIPLRTPQHHSLEGVNEELQGFATQELDPALATWDSTTSSTVPPPTGSLDVSPEPPPPVHKDSILQVADSPHLQLPVEGFGVMEPAATPPASPQPGLVASENFFHMPPPTHLDLGNCYEALCTAKAQKLVHLQKAAYKVMSDNYLQVLRTPSIYGRLNAGERELILGQRMKGMKCMVVADVNVKEPDLHASRLCYYDDRGDCWRPLCPIPPEVVSRGCAMCSMFNYLFVVAGCEGTGRAQRRSNRVFCYDPLTNIWREICPLNQARPHCKLVALDGHLYAIGGECLHTVERYDPRRDRWAFTAPLPHDTFAVAHTATACDGEIYVTGGTLRYVLLRYTPSSDSWRVSPAGAGGKDRTVEMVSANGFVYRFDFQRRAGVAVSRCSSKAKLWYECATYATANPPSFQCAVVGSLIHCVGRRFHTRFLADHLSPRFGTKELQPFPSPHGSLLTAVLVLPEGREGQAQAQV